MPSYQLDVTVPLGLPLHYWLFLGVPNHSAYSRCHPTSQTQDPTHPQRPPIGRWQPFSHDGPREAQLRQHDQGDASPRAKEVQTESVITWPRIDSYHDVEECGKDDRTTAVRTEVCSTSHLNIVVQVHQCSLAVATADTQSQFHLFIQQHTHLHALFLNTTHTESC